MNNYLDQSLDELKENTRSSKEPAMESMGPLSRFYEEKKQEVAQLDTIESMPNTDIDHTSPNRAESAQLESDRKSLSGKKQKQSPYSQPMSPVAYNKDLFKQTGTDYDSSYK